MTERDYAIRSFKEITLNAAQHTEERMDLYYEKMKALMNNYQDLILENQTPVGATATAVFQLSFKP